MNAEKHYGEPARAAIAIAQTTIDSTTRKETR